MAIPTVTISHGGAENQVTVDADTEAVTVQARADTDIYVAHANKTVQSWTSTVTVTDTTGA